MSTVQDPAPAPPKRLLHRLIGGRVNDSGSFPDSDLAYQHMTPGERMEALYRLSRRAFTCIPESDARKRLQGIPNRLIGGRR